MWSKMLMKIVKISVLITLPSTGKSLSEALLFAEHGENMLCTKIVLNARDNFCTQHVLPRFELGIFMYWTCNSMNNLSSYCGLVDAKIRASDKYLPVNSILISCLKFETPQPCCYYCYLPQNSLDISCSFRVIDHIVQGPPPVQPLLPLLPSPPSFTDSKLKI